MGFFFDNGKKKMCKKKLFFLAFFHIYLSYLFSMPCETHLRYAAFVNIEFIILYDVLQEISGSNMQVESNKYMLYNEIWRIVWKKYF